MTFFFAMETLAEFSDPLLPGLDESTFGAELLESAEVQAARYSGKIVDKNREKVGAIVAARAMGFGVRQVCEAFHISPHTLAELERRHGQKLATLKERCARKFGVFVELGLDRAIAEVSRMDIDKLMISLGIATEKLQLLDGAPTAIIGTDEPKRFSVDALRERLARAHDVTPTGLGGEEGHQTRATGAPGGPALEVSAASSEGAT
jgi:hypothetical protein